MDNNKINFETERKKNSDIKIDYVENFKNLCGNTNIENPLHAWNFRQFFQPGGNQTPLLHDMHHHGIKCPISLEVKLNSSKEYEYLLHPGRSRHWAYHMLGQEDIPFPVIIHSRYKDNINFSHINGIEVKKYEDFGAFFEASARGEINYTIVEVPDHEIWATKAKGVFSTTKEVLSPIQTLPFENIKKYNKLVFDSLPLNVYSKNRPRVLDSDSIRPYVYDLPEINKEIRIIFNIILKNDIYKIPERNNFKGMAVYVDPNLNWNTKLSFFDIFYWGHTKIPICRHPQKSNIILFNCEHPFWKSGKDIKELKDDEIGLLPEHYNDLMI